MTARSALPLVACNRCRAMIGWVVTVNGNRMPVDGEPNPLGNVIVSYTDGKLLATVMTKDDRRPDGVVYMPHFATCGGSTRPRPAPKPEPPPRPIQQELL